MEKKNRTFFWKPFSISQIGRYLELIDNLHSSSHFEMGFQPSIMHICNFINSFDHNWSTFKKRFTKNIRTKFTSKLTRLTRLTNSHFFNSTCLNLVFVQQLCPGFTVRKNSVTRLPSWPSPTSRDAIRHWTGKTFNPFELNRCLHNYYLPWPLFICWEFGFAASSTGSYGGL